MILRTGQGLQGNHWESPISIISTILSFVSLFNGASGIFSHLKYVQLNEPGDQMPTYSWKSKSVIFLSFLMTIGPRLLVFVYFGGGCIGFSIFLVTYCATFFPPAVLMYQKIKAKADYGKFLQHLLWALFSGPVSPCIVIHPKSKTLLISSVSSVLAHLALLVYHYFDLLSLAEINSEHQWFWKWRIPNHGDELHMVMLGILMGLLLISLLFSVILHFLSKGEMKSACFSLCKSEKSCFSKKHSGEKTGRSTEWITNDLIEQSPAEECKCKCFNWFKCKKTCSAKNVGKDCISLRSITNIDGNEGHERISHPAASLNIENETLTSEAETKVGELVVNQIIDIIIGNALKTSSKN